MAIDDGIGDVVRSAVPSDPDPDVALGEFFDADFMGKYTQFDSFAAFCAASPWEIEDEADLRRIPADELDRFVRRTTRFDRWVAMRNRAGRREVRERHLL